MCSHFNTVIFLPITTNISSLFSPVRVTINETRTLAKFTENATGTHRETHEQEDMDGINAETAQIGRSD